MRIMIFDTCTTTKLKFSSALSFEHEFQHRKFIFSNNTRGTIRLSKRHVEMKATKVRAPFNVAMHIISQNYSSYKPVLLKFSQKYHTYFVHYVKAQ